MERCLVGRKDDPCCICYGLSYYLPERSSGLGPQPCHWPLAGHFPVRPMGILGDSGNAWASIAVTWLSESSKNKTSHANCHMDSQLVSPEQAAEKIYFIFVLSSHVEQLSNLKKGKQTGKVVSKLIHTSKYKAPVSITQNGKQSKLPHFTISKIMDIECILISKIFLSCFKFMICNIRRHSCIICLYQY